MVHALSTVVILYGRRRTVLMILVGFVVGALVRTATREISRRVPDDYMVIGFIIPGLIATWLDRQGILATLCSLVTASVVVRLVLILFVGAELLP